jgi:hypothetical protein
LIFIERERLFVEQQILRIGLSDVFVGSNRLLLSENVYLLQLFFVCDSLYLLLTLAFLRVAKMRLFFLLKGDFVVDGLVLPIQFIFEENQFLMVISHRLAVNLL